MSTDTGIVARRFFVSGRVQGVFFRASARTEAERLDVRGHALNLPDGRVEVLAIGSQAAVDELAEWLQHGPPAARVDIVTTEAADAAGYANVSDFSCGRA